MQYIQSYFLNGTLPAEGVVCPVTGPIFSPPQPSNDTGADGVRSTRDLATREDKDKVIIVALERLRQSFRLRSPF